MILFCTGLLIEKKHKSNKKSKIEKNIQSDNFASSIRENQQKKIAKKLFGILGAVMIFLPNA